MNPNPHCRIGKIKPKGNIHLFPGTIAPDVPVHRQPHKAVIDYLCFLLDLAENGDIQGIAVAYTVEDGVACSGWRGGESYSSAVLLGAMHLCASDYARATLNRSEELPTTREPS